MNDPVFKTRDARMLDVDEMRALVRVANNQNEGTNHILDAQGQLDLWWATFEAGFVSWEDWYYGTDTRTRAGAALDRAVAAVLLRRAEASK